MKESTVKWRICVVFCLFVFKFISQWGHISSQVILFIVSYQESLTQSVCFSLFRILDTHFLIFAQKLFLLNKLCSLKMTRSYCHFHSRHRKAFDCYQMSELLILHFPIIWFPYHKFHLNETHAREGVAEELFVATYSRLPAIIWVYGCVLEWMHYGERNSPTFQYTQYIWVIYSHLVYLQALTVCLCEVPTLKLALKNWIISLYFYYHRSHVHSVYSDDYQLKTTKHLAHLKPILTDTFSQPAGECAHVQVR